MKKNLFVRYNVMCIAIIILSNCFIAAIIMYIVADYSQYSFMKGQMGLLIENAMDDYDMGFYTFESSLQHAFKFTCPRDMRLVLYDEDKEVLYTDLEDEYIGTIDLQYFAKKIEHNGEYSGKKSIGLSNLNRKCHIFGTPVKDYNENSRAKYIVLIDLADDFRKSSYHLVVVRFIIAIICIICFSILILLTYTHYITVPLRQMKVVAQEYAHGNFEPKVDVYTNDDIGELAQTMNSMSESIAKFEEASRNFVSNVSHEFKTPITSIIGFIDGLIDGTVPEEKRDYYLKIISNEVKRLSHLVQSMLNISKIESGGIKPVFVPVNINNIIGSILVGFFDKIESKNLDIHGMEDVDDCWVEGDENLVYQIFYNLIENAIKFSDESGCISFKFVQVAHARIVTVRNTGDGLTKEEVSRLFDRFYKTDQSRSKDKSGFGLGLNIVSTIVKLCNWRIHVKSEHGKYTEFILTFKGCELPENSDNNN